MSFNKPIESPMKLPEISLFSNDDAVVFSVGVKIDWLLNGYDVSEDEEMSKLTEDIDEGQIFAEAV